MFNRWVEKELLSTLEMEGMGCIPFSPLAQGLLTDRYLKGIPEGSRASLEVFLKRQDITPVHKTVVKLNELAKKRGQTLAQMALAWIIKDPRITSVLIGASSVAQIEDNVGMMKNREFTDDELQLIESILIETR
jgi:L-glyceraldehyde 3-phosphate reductase